MALIAKPTVYMDKKNKLKIPFSWKPPRYILNMPGARHDRVRKKFHILVDGDLIPAPIKSFREMKLPPGLPATDDAHAFVSSHHFCHSISIL